MSLEKECYAQHWEVLKPALALLLSTPERCRDVVSFQETYHSVYRCVHLGFSKQLYTDLLAKVSDFLNTWSSHLDQKKGDPVDFLRVFDATVKLYLEALKGIVPIFLYLNRVYLLGKLKLNLHTVLMDAFKQQLLSHHVAHVIELIEAMQGQPLLLDPGLSASIICQLHSLDSGYANMNTGLFSKFIAPKPADVLQHDPDMDLVQKDVVETHSLEKQILHAFDGNRGDQRRKRGCSSVDSDI